MLPIVVGAVVGGLLAVAVSLRGERAELAERERVAREAAELRAADARRERERASAWRARAIRTGRRLGESVQRAAAANEEGK